MTVLLQKFWKWTIQNSLRLLKAVVKKKQYLKNEAHIFNLYKTFESLFNTTLYNNFNICQVLVDIHIFC